MMMPKLSSPEVFIFLVQLTILLVLAKGMGEIAKKFRQPAVIGEIIGGVIVGPTILGTFFPKFYEWLFFSAKNATMALDGIILLSVVFLLFVVGLEIDTKAIAKQGKALVWTSAMGVIIPFVFGGAIGWFLFPFIESPIPQKMFALLLGAALSISALPVIARVLSDIGMLKTGIGNLMIAVASINDAIGWIIFTVILGLSGHAAAQHVNIWLAIAITCALVVMSFTVLPKFFNFIMKRVFNFSKSSGAVLGMSFILMFVFAVFVEYLGIHPVFGALIVGVALSSSTYLKKELKHGIANIVDNIFSPFFFAAVGLKTNFFLNFDLFLIAVVIFLAYFTKIFAGWLGGKIAGLSRDHSIAIGIAIAARGGMGIIMAIIAFDAHLITAEFFEALVVMGLVTCLTSSMIGRYIKKGKEESQQESIVMAAHHQPSI